MNDLDQCALTECQAPKSKAHYPHCSSECSQLSDLIRGRDTSANRNVPLPPAPFSWLGPGAA